MTILTDLHRSPLDFQVFEGIEGKPNKFGCKVMVNGMIFKGTGKYNFTLIQNSWLKKYLKSFVLIVRNF